MPHVLFIWSYFCLHMLYVIGAKKMQRLLVFAPIAICGRFPYSAARLYKYWARVHGSDVAAQFFAAIEPTSIAGQMGRPL